MKGTIESIGKDQASADARHELFGDDGHLRFESSDGRHSGRIKIGSVKAIYFSAGADADLQSGMRFFDSAPIPCFLWVRAAFLDGEAVEGMIANTWSAFNSVLIRLHVPDQLLDQREVLIPRTSIAELHVITTR